MHTEMQLWQTSPSAHFRLRESKACEASRVFFWVRAFMGRQMYFYYLEWLFVYNQNKAGYLQITTLQFYYF